MNAVFNESAVVFQCQHTELLGVVHTAVQGGDLGVLTIVAGGPQYRGGCGRQLVELGRELAGAGIHTFRFDHRGMGDSAGEFAGFEDMLADLQAAIIEFKRHIPSLKRIILWGGCDAASAALINAHLLPEVVAVIAANPWITTAKSEAKSRRRHYVRRLLDPAFWAKLVRGGYALADAKEAIGTAGKRSASAQTQKAPSAPTSVHQPPQESFLDRMRSGAERFEGRLLFLASGRSVTSKEFADLIKSDRRWKKIIDNARNDMWLIENADQTFSTTESRRAMLDAALRYCSEFL